ncbi:MAG TPA: hypothetical protein VK530_01795 [Candidatus Acidoferrum sp.]|nr:hypothetical protein [Candidatus Acidoferrum sp.]
MNFENPIVWIAAGISALLIGVVVLKQFFSEEARIERRRRKSNARVVSNARRPAVKLSVKTKRKNKE